MNKILENLISELPKSPTHLSKSNRNKIYRLLPVPKDYEILWADISSFGGYPAGIVLTDKALIFKASKNEIKHNKKEIKIEDKKKKPKEKTVVPKILYRIIPWEYYTPEDYDIEVNNVKGVEGYTLKSGNFELVKFSSIDLFNMLSAYKKLAIETQEVAQTTFSGVNTVNVEGVMFNATYGSNQTKTGHGIYAEEAGSILDKLSGEESTVVGRDNAKNGPDKIVNSAPIQCKYCKGASRTINACFKVDPSTGLNTFRYVDLEGKPMRIEVPSDQYLRAVEIFKKKIQNGQVPGVTDPNAASEIIRKGKLTYKQALNLAKAGKIESITFDMATGAINCLSVFGISAVVTFAQTYWVTKDYKQAAKSAIFSGLQVYGLTFVGGIIASQISRTGIATILEPIASGVSKKIGSNATQDIINVFRTMAGKSAIYGSAAQKSFVKVLGSNAIAEAVMFVVFSVPDTYNLINRKISKSQFLKNTTSLGASLIGNLIGGPLAGIAIGKKFGDSIKAWPLKIICLLAGLLLGATLGIIVKLVGRLFHEDDSVIMSRLFYAVLQNLFADNMLTSNEQNVVMEELKKSANENKKFQRNLFASEKQELDIIDYVQPKIDAVLQNRAKINNEDNEKWISEL